MEWKKYYTLNKEKIIQCHKQWLNEHRHPCPTCGKLVQYKSKACSKHAGTGRSGQENHRWKGGRCKTGGYIVVKKPSHPKANAVANQITSFGVYSNTS